MPRQTKVMLILAAVFVILFPPLALVFAIIALAQLAHDPARRGLAIASLVTLLASVVMMVIIVGLLLRAGALFERASRIGPPGRAGQQDRPFTEVGAKYECLSHMKNLALAADMWARDHANRLPAADRWVDDLAPYVRDPHQFRCSRDTSGARSSYGMNVALSGADISTVANPERVVLFYETAHPGDNPSGGPQDVVAARHYGEGNFAYLNGQAASLESGQQVSFAVQ